MRKLTAAIAAISLLVAVPAHAQFGNLLQNIKGAIDSATTPSSSNKGTSGSSSSGAAGGGDYEPCIQKQDTYFRCTIKGKPVGVCTNFDTDAPSVNFIMGKMDKNYVHEYMNSVYEGAKDRFMVAQHSDGKFTLTTVSIKDYKDKSLTYSITECQGMECNMDKSTWLTITKGQSEIAGGGFCDVGSSTGFNFPFNEDKNGNLVIKMKGYFAPQKKPFPSSLTTNRSWSE